MKAALIALPFLSQAAGACPFCFGAVDPNSGFSHGIFYGILLLISATFFILGWLTGAVIRMERHKSTSESKAR